MEIDYDLLHKIRNNYHNAVSEAEADAERQLQVTVGQELLTYKYNDDGEEEEVLLKIIKARFALDEDGYEIVGFLCEDGNWYMEDGEQYHRW